MKQKWNFNMIMSMLFALTFIINVVGAVLRHDAYAISFANTQLILCLYFISEYKKEK